MSLTQMNCTFYNRQQFDTFKSWIIENNFHYHEGLINSFGKEFLIMVTDESINNLAMVAGQVKRVFSNDYPEQKDDVIL